MGIPSNPDTATLNDWLSAIASSSSLDAQHVVYEFARRFHIRPQISVSPGFQPASGGVTPSGATGTRAEWFSLVRSGFGFTSGNQLTVAAGGAGNISALQVRNPPGSAVRIFVFDVLVWAGAVEEVSSSIATVQLATLLTAGANIITPGGAATVAELRSKNNDVTTDPGTNTLTRSTMAAGTWARIVPPLGGQMWIELKPGSCLNIWGLSANIALNALVLFAEVPTSYL